MKKTIIFPDEIKYVGEVKNGKPHGKGTLTWPDEGGKYVGQWKNGKFHGEGILTFPWDEIQKGNFINGKHESELKQKKIKYDYNWRYLEGESSEEYEYRVLPQVAYKSIKKKFDKNKFLKLLEEFKKNDFFEVLTESCDGEKEIAFDFKLQKGEEEELCPDMWIMAHEFIFNKFFSKIDKDIEYVPICSYYSKSEILGEFTVYKLDLLKIKKSKNCFLVSSGINRDGTKFSNIDKKISIKINDKEIMDETLKLIKKNWALITGFFCLNGNFNWNIDKVFSIYYKDYYPDDEDKVEENSFVFLSKNTNDYEIGSKIFHYTYATSTTVWDEPSISDSIEEQKVDKSIRNIVKKRFKNHYQYNYSKKKWEICDIFSTRN
tara:strand:- start:40 stop:1167 length:1128 start_codon:yes stop_codon:yes gene_type:complete